MGAGLLLGVQTAVWWVPIQDDGRGAQSVAESEEVRIGGSSGESTTSDTASPRAASDAVVTSGALADVEFPDGRDRDECEAAVYAVRDYLKEYGPALIREIVAEVMPKHSLGYEVPDLEPDDRYRGSWWRRVVKSGITTLPDVTEAGGEWRYDDD